MPSTTGRHDDSAKNFEAVRAREVEYVRRRRQSTEGVPDGPGVAESLIGLALSGGGIRSATTNLGVLQALSRMGLLRLVDYLSTVSGGGYIGGCLSALLSINTHHEPSSESSGRFAFSSREDLRFGTEWPRFPFNAERGASANLVTHLRTHGDFLVTGDRTFQRQTLRAAGVLVGAGFYNFILAMLSVFVTALLILGAAHSLTRGIVEWRGPLGPGTTDVPDFLPLLRDHLMSIVESIPGSELQIVTALLGGGFATMVLLLAFLFAETWGRPTVWTAGESREDAYETSVIRLGATLMYLTMVLVPLANAQVAPERTSLSWLLQPGFVAAGAFLTAVFAYVLLAALGTHRLWSRSFRSIWGSYLALTRYGVIVALGLAVAPAVFYAYHAVGFKGLDGLVASLISGGVLSLLFEPLLGVAKRLISSPRAVRRVQRVLIASLGGLTTVFVAAFVIDMQLADPTQGSAFVVALAISVTALAVLSVTVNFNRIGLLYFYRDRILETYLRSEVMDRDGRLKTSVDATEMRLHDLHGNPSDDRQPGNSAPYLLINAALNLAGSRDVNRRGRKWGYFLFSKFFCGSRQTGFRETSQYSRGQTSLASALTLSGAPTATAPGYKKLLSQSFFTALFNAGAHARVSALGQWIPNPSTNTRELAFWPVYFLREALGATNERTRLVHVSDGGNTGDNVGIYPLFERQCQVIIAYDAEADARLAFDSFTQALLDAKTDLGVEVDIDLSMIVPDPETGLSMSHCAIGRVRYPECGGRPNWLVYLKQSLTGNEPAHVLNYKRRASDFPHETDADQSFDDDQFEAYRALGEHIAEETFARWILNPDIRQALGLPMTRPRTNLGMFQYRLPVPALAWDELRINHSPFRAAGGQEFQELMQALSALDQLVLATPSLQWYYAECMALPPEPSTAGEKSDAIQFIAMQIQLMENVYYRLRLDHYANARDNRGWMNLFRRWGRSKTFTDGFRKLQSNYSRPFVFFYFAYVQDWMDIDQFPIPHPWDIMYSTETGNAHPSAVECRGRGVPGFFQDPGRWDVREPEVHRQEHPVSGQHGGAWSQTEARPPTLPPLSKE